MEKICQNVWHLPIVEAPGQLLCNFVTENGGVAKHQVQWLREVVEAKLCLPPNPRKLKGLANLVARLCSRLPDDLEKDQGDRGRDEMRKLLVVAYVHQFHHDLFVRWQANPSLYNAIGRWCRGEAKDDVLGGLLLPIDPDRDSKDTFSAGSDPIASTDQAPGGPGPVRLRVGSALGPQEGSEDAPALGLVKFPDPTAANLFWVGSIVRDLPDHVGPRTFARYLVPRTP